MKFLFVDEQDKSRKKKKLKYNVSSGQMWIEDFNLPGGKWR